MCGHITAIRVRVRHVACAHRSVLEHLWLQGPADNDKLWLHCKHFSTSIVPTHGNYKPHNKSHIEAVEAVLPELPRPKPNVLDH